MRWPGWSISGIAPLARRSRAEDLARWSCGETHPLALFMQHVVQRDPPSMATGATVRQLKLTASQ
jgi:hypothetical protein